MADRIEVIGLLGGHPVGEEAAVALRGADVVVGTAPQLAAHGRDRPTLDIATELAEGFERVAATAGTVAVLASGDPGFFGVVRPLAARFGPAALRVHPAPSSVSLTFARLGLPWDAAAVVSAHGRSLGAAADAVAEHLRQGTTVAVLTAPDAPPEALGHELRCRHAAAHSVWVASAVAEPEEAVVATDLDGLGAGRYPHRSVVVLAATADVPSTPSLARALSEDALAHREGLVTKPEVRAVVLARLDLPERGVLWDVGTGSGSVAIEAALARPSLDVVALDRDPAAADRARDNAGRHGARLDVRVGEAPAALADLPAPQRAFVGGGGPAVLDAVRARLPAGARVVATYARMDAAAAAHDRLGNLVQLSVARGRPLAGGIRLAADNPVFVVWGDA